MNKPYPSLDMVAKIAADLEALKVAVIALAQGSPNAEAAARALEQYAEQVTADLLATTQKDGALDIAAAPALEFAQRLRKSAGKIR